MLKKRLIAVITVKNGWAVQSFGYERYLPLGKPEVLAENLDRWGADEILLQCIDRSVTSLGPDFALLERIGKRGLGTPLIYCGGISSVNDGVKAIKLGADRICVETLLHGSPTTVRELSSMLGAQALIGAFPLSIVRGECHVLNYITGEHAPIESHVRSLLEEKIVSEALIIDWKNEGVLGGFDFRIMEELQLSNVPLIAFGGLGEPVSQRIALEIEQVVAISVGNFLNYRETSVEYFKNRLAGLPLRVPTSPKVFSQL